VPNSITALTPLLSAVAVRLTWSRLRFVFTTEVAHSLPFPGPRDGIVVCAETVPLGQTDVLVVQTFPNESGGFDWLFYTTPSDLEPDRLVPLELASLLRLDSTLHDVADLPVNWVAVRKSRSTEWARFPRKEAGPDGPAS
jgi:hypothetical protein